MQKMPLGQPFKPISQVNPSLEERHKLDGLKPSSFRRVRLGADEQFPQAFLIYDVSNSSFIASSFLRASSFVIFPPPVIPLAGLSVFGFVLSMPNTQLTWYGHSAFKL